LEYILYIINGASLRGEFLISWNPLLPSTSN